MVDGFNEHWAVAVVDELVGLGISVERGLSSAEVASIGEAFGAEVPPELALLLTAGVPVAPRWPRWLDGPETVAAEAREWIAGAFAFDIEHAGYWHPRFGGRPATTADAIEQALAVVAAAPPLVPVYGHRFLCTVPVDAPRAVLSVWQAVDTIYYGADLADYLHRELGVTRPDWAGDEMPPVPVWGELFEL